MRPTKNEYYLMIAERVKNRGTCLRAKIGAIIVRDDQIIATGYLGSPRQTKDCLERNDCLRDKLNIPHGQRYELCRSVHAEQNCILNAARAGVSLLNGDMYIYGENQKGEKTDAFPCFICKKMIINAGLKRVVCSTREGDIKVFNVEDWARDWQEKDIIDDQQQYGKDQNK
ncbi:MAG: dCMP deaminase family protein [Patescibacteria group bacterium]|nr:dCMP deaminase family protein [Patescibacteria group bacterium]MDD5164275.1 dCMP deaminase family protein [Patescibacteria group bacterium]MDD5535044.1 dCMP deaminase family protein [Patescibacteria group bacterium]